MNGTQERQQNQTERTPRAGHSRRGHSRPWRWSGRWHWPAVLAVLIALVAMDGRSAEATSAAPSLAIRVADAARRVATPTTHFGAAGAPALAPLPSVPSVRDAVLKADMRPDLRVAFEDVDDVKVGMPLTYTVRLRNAGQDAGAVTVSTILPPEFSNVRVSASGFACTRRFSASGSQAGTRVACTRSDLGGGDVTELTIEANAPNTAGSYRLTATADPRDETDESDESNNDADTTIRVRD